MTYKEKAIARFSKMFPNQDISELIDAYMSWSYHFGLIKPEPITSNKIGRNDPCPCGSGRKYKRCCS